jgi:hypothetical protein
MNARDLFEIVEPALADARSKVTPLLGLAFGQAKELVSFDQAKERHAEAGPVTRIASGLAAGMLAGKLVSSLGR